MSTQAPYNPMIIFFANASIVDVDRLARIAWSLTPARDSYNGIIRVNKEEQCQCCGEHSTTRLTFGDPHVIKKTIIMCEPCINTMRRAMGEISIAKVIHFRQLAMLAALYHRDIFAFTGHCKGPTCVWCGASEPTSVIMISTGSATHALCVLCARRIMFWQTEHKNLKGGLTRRCSTVAATLYLGGRLCKDTVHLICFVLHSVCERDSLLHLLTQAPQ